MVAECRRIRTPSMDDPTTERFVAGCRCTESPDNSGLGLTNLRDRVRAAADKADRGQLEQVLMNLAVNARDVIVHQGVVEEGVQLIEKPFSADARVRKVRHVLDGTVDNE
jgi:signal transduction histidine kinase